MTVNYKFSVLGQNALRHMRGCAGAVGIASASEFPTCKERTEILARPLRDDTFEISIETYTEKYGKRGFRRSSSLVVNREQIAKIAELIGFKNQ